MKYPEEELFDLSIDPGFCVLPSGYEFPAKDGWLKPIEGVFMPFAQTRLEEVRQENGDEFHLSEYPFLN